MGKVVGVISLKGGVGKTSSVISLGSALNKLGKKVLLIDGNYSAPNLGLHLDIIEPNSTIHHVLAHDHNIQDAIHETHGMHVIPASIFHKHEINPLKLKSKLRYLKDNYDVILLDSSPSLDQETLSVMLASDELLVVTTPDISTLTMTLKAANLAKQRGTPITGLILNKVYNKNFELSLDDIERTSSVPVMAVIPHDTNILKSQANFIPYVHHKPRSQGAHEYTKLAAMLVGEKYKPFRLRDYVGKLVPDRQEINREIFYETQF